MSVVFSIVTTTILRPTLVKTCKTIDEQSFKGYEHIIIIDMPKEQITREEKAMILELEANPRRHFIYSDTPDQDCGGRNIARRRATETAIGEYIMYIDDDDYYVNDTLAELMKHLSQYNPKERPGMAIFRCWRWDHEFTNFPPASCQTVSCQWIHKRILHEQPILWPPTHRYKCSDGRFIEFVKKLTEPVLFKTDEVLVIVTQIGDGNKANLPKEA